MNLVKKADIELGKAVTEAAAEQERKRKQDKVVKQVQQVIASIDGMEQAIEANQECLANLKAQFEAIQKGEFSIKTNGALLYHDSALNSFSHKKSIGSAYCTQCGSVVPIEALNAGVIS